MKDKRLLIIFLTVFVDLVGFGIIIPMNPYLAERFGATPLQVGLLMSVYSLMQFIFSPLWGQWSDRIGRRPIILMSLLGASLAHLGFAFAGSFWTLVLARTLAGVFGGNLSAAMAYIADITPEKDRSKGMGLIGAAFGLGFILGPALGGFSAHVGLMLGGLPPFGQSFPAVIASTICFLNFLSAWRFLPESLTARANQDRGHRLQKIVRALTTPTLGVLMLILFLNTLALAHVEATLFLYVQEKFSWTLMQASFGFAYIGVMMVITQGYLIRKMLPKWGERKVLALGLGCSTLAFILGSIAGTQLWILTVAVTFLGLGNGMAGPSLNGGISLLTEQKSQGGNLGVSQSLASLARILGPPTGGFLFQRLNPSMPFASAAVMMILAVVMTFKIWPKIPSRGQL